MPQFNIAPVNERSSHANDWATLVQKAMLGEELVVAYDNRGLVRLIPQPNERHSFAAVSTALRALLVRLDALLQAQGPRTGGAAVERELTVLCDDPLLRKLGVQPPGGIPGAATSSVGQIWAW